MIKLKSNHNAAGINRKHLIVFMLVILGVILRVIYLYQYSSSPMFNHIIGPDVGEYEEWAASILQGNFFWSKTSIHSPLYSYYLAVLMYISGGDYFFIRLFQLVIGIIPFLFLFNILYKFKSLNYKITKFIAYSFLCLGLFFVPLFYYQGEIISEALLTPLICFAIYFLYKSEIATGSKPQEVINNRSAATLSSLDVDNKDTNYDLGEYKRIKFTIISGVILGLAVITHPISLFFIFAEFVYLLFIFFQNVKQAKIYSVKYLAAFIIPVILIAGSVSAYNSYLDKKFVFIQKNSGYNLFLGNNAKANGMCNVSAGPEWNEVHTAAKSAAAKQGVSEERYFYGQVCSYIKNNPVDWIKLICKKALLVWNNKDIYSSLDPLAVKYFTGLMRVTRYSFGILAVFALFGLFSIIRKPYHALYQYRHFIILVLSIWIGLSFTVVSDRYRYLMLPGLFVLASYGCIAIYSGVMNSKKVLTSVFLLILTAVIVYLPLYKIDIPKDRAFADSMYGEAYLENGEYEIAKEFLLKAVSRFPEWDRCYINLGIIEMESNPQQAIEYFKKAYEYKPGNSIALLNIALAYDQLSSASKGTGTSSTYTKNQTKDLNTEHRYSKSFQYKSEAEKFFRAAFEIDKETPELIYSYGFFLYNLKRYKDALNVLSYAEKNKCMDNKIRNLMGIIFLIDNMPDRAVYYFNQAVLYSSLNLNYKLNLAFAYMKNKNFIEAKNIIDDILNSNPNNERAIKINKILIKSVDGK